MSDVGPAVGDGSQMRTILDELYDAYRKYGNDIAIYSPQEGIQMSYTSLLPSVLLGGQYIKTRVLNKSNRMIVTFVNEGIALPVTWLSIVAAGYAFVPVSPEDPEEYIKGKINDIEPAAVVILTKHMTRTKAYLKREDITWIVAEELMLITQTKMEDDIDTESMLPKDLHNICYGIYTSGSTGFPKCCIIRHESILSFSRHWVESMQFERNDRILLASSFTFDPSIGDTFASLIAGSTLVLYPRAQILEQLVHILQSEKVTHITATPALFCLAVVPPPEIPSLRTIALGGEPMRPDIALRWGHLEKPKLYNVYGVTEATVYQSFCLVSKDKLLHNIGQPLPGIHSFLADFDTDKMLTRSGDLGQICIQGVQVGCGYLKREALTKERFKLHPFDESLSVYRTGDVGLLLEDGSIEFHGRKDRQIKLNGFRVELDEIEHKIRDVEFINEAVVLFTEGIIVSYIELTMEASLEYTYCPNELEVIDGCLLFAIKISLEKSLPPHMFPRHFILMRKLPRNNSDKLDRTAVPNYVNALDRANKKKLRLYPSSANEHALVFIWGQVLGLSNISTDDNFFLIGGDSLMSLRMLQKMSLLVDESSVNVGTGEIKEESPFSLKALRDHPVLSAYAEYLDSVGIIVDISTIPIVHTNAEHAISSIKEQINIQPELREKTADDFLMDAVVADWSFLVKYLLELGIDPNGGLSRKKKGSSPLHVAAGHNNVRITEALLRHGVHVYGVNIQQATAMHIAAAQSNDVLRVLLDAGVRPTVIDKNQHTVFHYAARYNNVTALKLFLVMPELKPFLDFRDRWQRSPLHWAILQGHVEAVQILLDAGASITLPKKAYRLLKHKTRLQGQTALEAAEEMAHKHPENRRRNEIMNLVRSKA